jgi:hypothetical protein
VPFKSIPEYDLWVEQAFTVETETSVPFLLELKFTLHLDHIRVIYVLWAKEYPF